jgi:hypothetical protein
MGGLPSPTHSSRSFLNPQPQHACLPLSLTSFYPCPSPAALRARVQNRGAKLPPHPRFLEPTPNIFSGCVTGPPLSPGMG